MKIKQLAATGYRVLSFSPASFATQLVEAQLAGRTTAFYAKVQKAPLVFFDDFGKAKFTETVEVGFFEIIEQRTAWQRPTIITTNETGTTLASRMSSTRYDAFVERLREFFTVINYA